jgi:hypothetical protein
VSNVLSDDKQKQVIALGQLGWTLPGNSPDAGPSLPQHLLE